MHACLRCIRIASHRIIPFVGASLFFRPTLLCSGFPFPSPVDLFFFAFLSLTDESGPHVSIGIPLTTFPVWSQVGRMDEWGQPDQRMNG